MLQSRRDSMSKLEIYVRYVLGIAVYDRVDEVMYIDIFPVSNPTNGFHINTLCTEQG